MSFQLQSLFQFRAHQHTITNVIVDLHALNWNDVEVHIMFQLRALPVVLSYLRIKYRNFRYYVKNANIKGLYIFI